MQRVVKRPHIGVHFVLHFTGQKTNFFACLDCRAAKDNAFNLAGFERGGGHCHRKIGFTGARGADTKS